MRKTMTIGYQLRTQHPPSDFMFPFLFRKYKLMKIINAINTSLNNNHLIEPPSSTIMFYLKTWLANKIDIKNKLCSPFLLLLWCQKFLTYCMLTPRCINSSQVKSRHFFQKKQVGIKVRKNISLARYFFLSNLLHIYGHNRLLLAWFSPFSKNFYYSLPLAWLIGNKTLNAACPLFPIIAIRTRICWQYTYLQVLSAPCIIGWANQSI